MIGENYEPLNCPSFEGYRTTPATTEYTQYITTLDCPGPGWSPLVTALSGPSLVSDADGAVKVPAIDRTHKCHMNNFHLALTAFAIFIMAATLRSTSSSEVAQLETEIRMAV